MTNIFKLNSAEKILQELERLPRQRNFPKAETFPFDKLYRKTVSEIKTTELSSECILYNSVEAFNNTTEFRKPDYWKESCKQEEIENWWIFGQNGQGDLWVFGKQGNIYFYDHDQEEMSGENFVNLGIDFAKWIQFADLNRQYDLLYDNYEKHFDNGSLKSPVANDYKDRLQEISLELLLNYPFKI